MLDVEHVTNYIAAASNNVMMNAGLKQSPLWLLGNHDDVDFRKLLYFTLRNQVSRIILNRTEERLITGTEAYEIGKTCESVLEEVMQR